MTVKKYCFIIFYNHWQFHTYSGVKEKGFSKCWNFWESLHAHYVRALFSASPMKLRKTTKRKKHGLSLSDNERANVVLGCINVTPSTATGYLFAQGYALPYINIYAPNQALVYQEPTRAFLVHSQDTIKCIESSNLQTPKFQILSRIRLKYLHCHFSKTTDDKHYYIPDTRWNQIINISWIKNMIQKKNKGIKKAVKWEKWL